MEVPVMRHELWHLSTNWISSESLVVHADRPHTVWSIWLWSNMWTCLCINRATSTSHICSSLHQLKTPAMDGNCDWTPSDRVQFQFVHLVRCVSAGVSDWSVPESETFLDLKYSDTWAANICCEENLSGTENKQNTGGVPVPVVFFNVLYVWEQNDLRWKHVNEHTVTECSRSLMNVLNGQLYSRKHPIRELQAAVGGGSL